MPKKKKLSLSVSDVATYVSFTLMAVIAGSGFLFTQVAKNSFPPFALTALRLSIGSVVLSLLYCVRSGGMSVETTDTDKHPGVLFLQLTALAIFNCVIPYTLYAFVLTTSTAAINSGTAGIVSATSPLIAAALSVCVLRHKEKPTLLLFGSVLMGLVGTAVVGLPMSHSGVLVASALPAYLLMLGATASKAVAAVFASACLDERDSLHTALSQTVIGAVLSWCLAFAFEWNVAHPSPPLLNHFGFFSSPAGVAVICVMCLGILNSGIVYVCQFYLIRSVGAVSQVSVDFFVPVVSMAESIIIFKAWSGVSLFLIVIQTLGVFIVVGALFMLHAHKQYVAKSQYARLAPVFLETHDPEDCVFAPRENQPLLVNE